MSEPIEKAALYEWVIPSYFPTYQLLYTAFKAKVAKYKEAIEKPGIDQYECTVNFGYGTYLAFINAVLKNAEEWGFKGRADLEVLRGIKADLVPGLETFKIKSRESTRKPYLKDLAQTVKETHGFIQTCFQQVQVSGKDLIPPPVEVRRWDVQQRNSGQTIGAAREPQKSFRGPSIEEPDQRKLRNLKKDWERCITTANIFYKIVNKLKKTAEENPENKKFAEKSLRQIHAEIIKEFCLQLRALFKNMEHTEHLLTTLTTFKELEEYVEKTNTIRNKITTCEITVLYDCLDNIYVFLNDMDHHFQNL
ncbi:MAG: hypothetical protein JSW14_05170 [Candidatus Bathyarchaeum sp.]|nr:MAG: hypothetical protein JSW14_05170 [Candidatus Bathyarchaeum sp.]